MKSQYRRLLNATNKLASLPHPKFLDKVYGEVTAHAINKLSEVAVDNQIQYFSIPEKEIIYVSPDTKSVL